MKELDMLTGGLRWYLRFMQAKFNVAPRVGPSISAAFVRVIRCCFWASAGFGVNSREFTATK